jgi:hypothetical protein
MLRSGELIEVGLGEYLSVGHDGLPFLRGFGLHQQMQPWLRPRMEVASAGAFAGTRNAGKLSRPPLFGGRKFSCVMGGRRLRAREAKPLSNQRRQPENTRPPAGGEQCVRGRYRMAETRSFFRGGVAPGAARLAPGP